MRPHARCPARSAGTAERALASTKSSGSPEPSPKRSIGAAPNRSGTSCQRRNATRSWIAPRARVSARCWPLSPEPTKGNCAEARCRDRRSALLRDGGSCRAGSVLKQLHRLIEDSWLNLQHGAGTTSINTMMSLWQTQHHELRQRSKPIAYPSLIYILYKLFLDQMISVTLSEFRAQQSEYIAAAQREPVEISSRGVGRPQHRATHSSCYRRISD